VEEGAGTATTEKRETVVVEGKEEEAAGALKYPEEHRPVHIKQARRITKYVIPLSANKNPVFLSPLVPQSTERLRFSISAQTESKPK